MKVCVGGTFDPFHEGHEALLRASAKLATSLHVGVTDGRLASRKNRSLRSWKLRALAVKEFLARIGYDGELDIKPLKSAIGPAGKREFQAIVVTPETEAGAKAINQTRRKNKVPPLKIHVVPHLLAQDRLPISATAIAEHRIDRQGRRKKRVEVSVGSLNPVKVDAAGYEMSAFLGRIKLHVVPVKVKSGVPEQPKGPQTLQGARNRALQAMKDEPADYAIGIEAGLIKLPGMSEYVDAQACVVLDRLGRETIGWGPGFSYPEWAAKRALKGEMISDILGPVANDPRIGSTTGAIGFLSAGRMDRMALTRQAVLMALLPRMNPELYAGTGS